jgi:hypothetical protein
MIARMWHCYTTPENADALEKRIQSEIIPRLNQIKGFQSGQLLRRNLLQEVEFVGITYFDSLDPLRALVGEDFGQLLLSEDALRLLLRFDKRASFYTIPIDTQKRG